jgi:curved DNA-binding protein CbpA
MNPYETLDVPPDADTPTIKRQYRRRAKTLHPDKGGNPESFHALHQALQVLLDPARREKYDKTGTVDPTEPDNSHVGAISIIVGFISQMVQQHVQQGGRDPEKIDLLTIAKKTFKEEILKFENSQVPIRKAAHTMARVLKRLTTKAKNPLLIQALQAQIDGTREPLRTLEQNAQAYRDAITLLETYEYAWDQPPSQPGTARTAYFLNVIAATW